MTSSPLRIAHITSECAPFMRVGGLGDVVSALAAEQGRRGHRVTVVMPAYRGLTVPDGWSREPLGGCDVPWGLGHEPAAFERLGAADGGFDVLLVDHEGSRSFFGRPGVYDDPARDEGYSDNGERFLFFCRAALRGLKGLGDGIDVVHAHNHQAGWTPCFVRTHERDATAFRRTATVFTLHDLGYQGIHDPFLMGLAGFGGELFYPASPFEYWGRLNFMKVGIAFADALNTVSPAYAREVRSSAEFGSGLEGLLTRRADDLRGILNGIDADRWNPARDPLLVAAYDAEDLGGKAANRQALLEAAGLRGEPDLPVIGMVTRLVEQKGLDLLEHGAREGFDLEARLVVLGSGEPRYEAFLQRLQQTHPGRVWFHHGFDERLAHLIGAGSDIFLMPSRYEPCGLNQMYAMRYGTPPVVRAVGGLSDTVQEFDPVRGTGTGFVFHRFAAQDMVAALRRALSMRRQPGLWRALQRNGMTRDFAWRVSGDRYDAMYAEALDRVVRTGGRSLEAVRASI